MNLEKSSHILEWTRAFSISASGSGRMIPTPTLLAFKTQTLLYSGNTNLISKRKEAVLFLQSMINFQRGPYSRKRVFLLEIHHSTLWMKSSLGMGASMGNKNISMYLFICLFLPSWKKYVWYELTQILTILFSGIKHLKSQSDSAFPEEEEGIGEREEEWDH